MQTNQFSNMDNLSASFNPSFLVGPGNEQQPQKLIASPAKAAKGGSNSSSANKKGDSDKPKRPLSAYNLFFQHERAQILKTTPSKYDGKKPRRSHGKIGFGALARSVAAKWNSIEPEQRKRFDEAAAADKQRYKKEMDAWKIVQAELKIKQQQAKPVMSSSAHTMNAQEIVRCNLMAASQASQDTGRAVFNMAANSNQASAVFPTLSNNYVAGIVGSNTTFSMENMRSGSGQASKVVGHALAMLQNDFRGSNDFDFQHYHQAQPMLDESEESMFSNTSGQARRVSGTVPHISELAAKLDDDCLGFMSELLF